MIDLKKMVIIFTLAVTVLFYGLMGRGEVRAEVLSASLKLVAEGGGQEDYFGRSVAVDGDTAVIGSSGDDEKGLNAGAAYVFVRSGGTWVLQQKLVAADGAEADLFGSSVAVAGDTVIVGAPLRDGVGSDAGVVYVFVRSGGVWTQQQVLASGDGSQDDYFGYDVALDGETALISATNASASYVFVRAGGVWSEEAKLVSYNDMGQLSGHSISDVSVSGDTAVIGVSGTLDNSGGAYVFTRAGGTWTQQQRLRGADGFQARDQAFSVSVDGDTAIVGAQLQGNKGAVYVFTRAESLWTEQQTLIASDGGEEDEFGYSVSLSGDVVLVGAIGQDVVEDHSGAVYLFKRSGVVWTEQQKWVAADAGAADNFGQSVSAKGSVMLVGAPNDDREAADLGAAYVFEFGGVEDRDGGGDGGGCATVGVHKARSAGGWGVVCGVVAVGFFVMGFRRR